MRYALVDSATGVVVNAIEIDQIVQSDPAKAWPVPEGHKLVASNAANVGDHWDGETFTAP